MNFISKSITVILLLSLIAGCSHKKKPITSSKPIYSRADIEKLAKEVESQHNNKLINKAICEVKQAKDINDHDLEYLRSKLLFYLENSKAGFNSSWKKLKPRVVSKIKHDKKIVEVYFKSKNKASTEIMKNLNRFIEYNDSGKFCGIYNDAIKYITENQYDIKTGLLNGKVPFGTEITAVKTMLIYSILVAYNKNHIGQFPAILDNLQYLYPASHDTDKFKALGLYGTRNGKSVIYLPNAGYIYGGKFINGKNYGTDCSEFALNLVGYTRYNLRDGPFIKKSKIKPGDIVLFRYKNSGVFAAGHAVIFVKFLDNEKRYLLVIDDARVPKCKEEGIAWRVTDYQKKNRKVQVLQTEK